MKHKSPVVAKIAALVAVMTLVALLVFVGLSYFRPSYSQKQIGAAQAGDAASPDEDYTVSIVGDISLADNWEVMPQYDQRGKGVNGILSD